MPYRRLPNTTPSVVRVQTVARDRYLLVPAPQRAITADQFAKLDPANPASFLNRFLKEVNDVDLAQSAQTPLTTAISVSAARLTMHVSHFYQALDMGIARGKFSAGARSFYHRDAHATALPSLASYEEVLKEANNIVDGEAARAAAEAGGVAHYDDGSTYDSGVTYAPDGSTGPSPHVPMSNPSAAEVQVVRDRFKALRNEVKLAENQLNIEQEEAMALYDEAQALAVDICDTVEFYYRKDTDASSRRAKCEEWGVVYVYEDATTPPVTPPVTPTPPTP